MFEGPLRLSPEQKHSWHIIKQCFCGFGRRFNIPWSAVVFYGPWVAFLRRIRWPSNLGEIRGNFTVYFGFQFLLLGPSEPGLHLRWRNGPIFLFAKLIQMRSPITPHTNSAHITIAVGPNVYALLAPIWHPIVAKWIRQRLVTIRHALVRIMTTMECWRFGELLDLRRYLVHHTIFCAWLRGQERQCRASTQISLTRRARRSQRSEA
jgi:hypothetical protein